MGNELIMEYRWIGIYLYPVDSYNRDSSGQDFIEFIVVIKWQQTKKS